MFLISLILVVLGIFTYLKLIKPCYYWQEKGVPHIKPWPVLGNMIQNFLGTRAFAHIMQDIYEKFPNERFVGVYHYTKPTIMLRDPDLIKQLYVKNSDYFPDHPPLSSDEEDSFVNKSLISLKGKAWHRMRSVLSPTFTSSKLKTMFGLMAECSKQFVRHFEQQNGDNNVKIKDAFTRFTNDVAASLALGISCDSMKDRENEIYSLGKKSLGEFPFFRAFGYAISPTLMRFFNVTFFDTTFQTMLDKVIHETIKIRESRDIFRPDMLHLLMEAKKGRLKYDHTINQAQDENFAVVQESEIRHHKNYKITDEDITAQAVLFYAAAFDTSSNFLRALAYELAVNPDVQENLQNEVDETLDQCSGEVTYEALLKMKYLDMVISEALRLWPVTTFSDRVCVKPYVVKPTKPEEKTIKIDVGTYIWLPLYALHRDPKYFSNPNKLDPERFNKENKDKILPFTYMPFGGGPRGCIAYRFALLETKVIMFHILAKFEILPVKETVIPFTLSKKNINLVTEADLVLGLKPREQII